MIIPARSEHLYAINDIYNQAIRDGFCTAHTRAIGMDKRRQWFQERSKSAYPVFIDIDQEEKEVRGWISLSPYRHGRQALDEVVEVSYYVDYQHHGKGIAGKLMSKAIAFSQEAGYRIMVAILISDNTPSKRIVEDFEFTEGGRIPNALHYQNEFRDHIYMYKEL
jgi:phosphinothricin acetyltransferase